MKTHSILTLSVINKHKPQYFLTNVPDLELPLPVQFYSLSTTEAGYPSCKPVPLLC